MKEHIIKQIAEYDFEKLFKEKGYKWYKGPYNLNIIGIRDDTTNSVTNKFDDILVVDYERQAITKRRRVIYNITTEPGKTYMLHNDKPTAILVPGQYLSSHKIGLHRGKYKALVQNKAVKVYRDGNKDLVYDMKPETIQNGVFGINIHRASQKYVVTEVNDFSAGCQVIQDPRHYVEFISICEKQKEIYGNAFTYTLLNLSDLHLQ